MNNLISKEQSSICIAVILNVILSRCSKCMHSSVTVSKQMLRARAWEHHLAHLKTAAESPLSEPVTLCDAG